MLLHRLIIDLRFAAIRTCCLAALSLLLLALPAESAAAAESPEATRSYIVVLKEDEVAHPGRVAQRHAINRDADLSSVYKTAIEGYAAEMTAADKQAIEGDPAVEDVVPNAKVEAFSQERPTGLRRIFVGQNPVLDPNGPNTVMVNVDVAIVDSGVDYTHPDLRVVRMTNCRVSAHACVDNSGDDANGHGTHVAGIVGALDNDIGVVGAAPGARLWSAKVLDAEGAGTMGDIIEGMDWVVAHAGAIEVVNLSVGCRTNDGECRATREVFETVLNSAIDAGVVVVVAASNDDWDVSGHGGPDITLDPITYPAAFPDVITVSNLADFDGQAGGMGEPICNGEVYPPDELFNQIEYAPELDDSLNFKSNYGSAVDIAAPGTCIRSTYKHGGYKRLSGTSMAAPYVSGAAAVLAVEENPSNRGDVMDIRDTLVNEGNYDWTDDSGHYSAGTGDDVQEPLLDISDESVFDLPGPGDVGAIGAVSDETYDLDVFARNGDNEIWRKSYRSNQWDNWSTIAGPNGEAIAGAPATISRRDGSMDIFVRAASGGIGFRNKWQETWSSWFPIYPPDNKAILGSPAATARPDIYDGLTLVVRGHDGNVYLKNYWESIPGGWSPWENLGAPAAGTASSPAITMHDESWLHLTVRGADGAIYGKAWGKAEQKWSGWVNLGTGFTSAPAMATSRSGDEMYLFGVKTDGKLWMRKAVAGVLGWSEWESLGGNVVADPAATSRESHGVSVFVVGLDNRIQERRYTYGGWTNWMRIDDDCPPEACSWDPGGPGTARAQSIESNDLVTVDAEGTVNVFPGYGEGFDVEDPVQSLEGELDSALLDGKGHFVIDVADVNDDDNSDLITVKDDGKVLVHLGTEERTFEEATDTGISLPPLMNGAGANEPIAVADVTGDGFDDFVAYIGTAGKYRFAVYKGQANGKFDSSPVQSLEANPGWLESSLKGGTHSFLDVIDVNGDGPADLVTATGTAVNVYTGSTSGQFGSSIFGTAFDSSLKDGTGTEPVGLGDVNADGRADLLVLDPEGKLKLYAGKADGSFASAASAYAGTIDSSAFDEEGKELFGLLDFDADGRADLIAGAADGDVLTYKAQADATFAEPVVQEAGMDSIRRANRSGHEVLLQKPFFKRPRCVAEGCPWPAVQMADSDVDGDGRSDLVTLHTSGTPHVYRGTAAGIGMRDPDTSLAGTLDPALYDGEGSYAIDVADVDGDEKGDLITEADGEVFTHPGAADARFGAPLAALAAGEGLEEVEPIAAADLTGDRRADLVRYAVIEEEGAILIAPGRPDGTFSSEEQTTSLIGALDSALLDGEGHYFLDAADVTGDGLADLVSMGTAGTVRVFAGEGGELAAGVSAASIDPVMDDGEGHEPVGLGDVNADGRADLLTLDPEGKLKLYAGKADGTFASATTPYGSTIDSNLLDGAGQELIGLLDYNRDRRADLFTLGSHGILRKFQASTEATFGSPVAAEETLAPNRFGATPGHELLAEKPFLRRAGCAAGGCEWPPTAPEAQPEPEEPEPTSWSPKTISKADNALEDIWCPSESECVAVGTSIDDAGVPRARIFETVTYIEGWEPRWGIGGTEADASELAGVTCATEAKCFAVGGYDDGGGAMQALILSGAGSSWSIAEVPLPLGAKSSRLNDVSCADATTCAAVGSVVDAEGVRHPLALHWNGTSWSVKPVQGAGTISTHPAGTVSSTSGELNDVSCKSKTACTAVGSYLEQGSGLKKPLAQEWNGSYWMAWQVPGMSGSTSRSLSGIWCVAEAQCAAVGTRIDATGHSRTWGLIRDSAGWSALATSNPPGDNSLSSVWCEANTSCVASGSSKSASGTRPLALTWEYWNTPEETHHLLGVPSGAKSSELAGTFCNASVECQLVGSVSYNGADRNLAAYSYDRDSASTVTEAGGTQSGPGGGALRDVSCPPGGGCVAIGEAAHPLGSQDGAIAWRYSGEEWKASPSAEASWPVLADVSCSAADQCTAVGLKGSPRETLAERWDGSSWTVQSTPNPSGGDGTLEMKGVSCSTSASCVSVGWFRQKTPLRDLPIAQKWNGSSWSAMTVPPLASGSAYLRDVSCASPESCFAVGSAGSGPLVQRWNGSAWSEQSVPSLSGALRGVSCSSASACTAVGIYTSGGVTRPLVLRWNGSAWSQQTPAEPAGFGELSDVSCYAASGCAAVGRFYKPGSGLSVLALRWHGGSWIVESTPGPVTPKVSFVELNSVSCSTAGKCVAVGYTEYEGGRLEHLVLESSIQVSDAATEQLCAPATLSGTTVSGGCSVDGFEGEFELKAGATFLGTYDGEFDLIVGSNGELFAVDQAVTLTSGSFGRDICKATVGGPKIPWAGQLSEVGPGEYEAELNVCLAAPGAAAGTTETVVAGVELIEAGTGGIELSQNPSTGFVHDALWSSPNGVLVEPGS